jgi:hypothetical protein
MPLGCVMGAEKHKENVNPLVARVLVVNNSRRFSG